MKVLPANPKKRKRKRSTGLRIIAVAVMVLFGIIAYSGISLREEKEALEKQYHNLGEQLQAEKERSLLLEERQAYMQTIRYIEEIAREKLGLVYKNEVIFRPSEEEE